MLHQAHTRLRSAISGSPGVIALGAIAVGALLINAPARAADLDYRTAPSDRYGTAYADPRYADIYGTQKPAPHPPHQAYQAYQHPGYGTGYPPIPQAPVYRYGDRGDAYAPPRYAQPDYAPRDFAPPGYAPYAGGYAPPPGYSNRGAYSSRAPGCLSKDTIQRELIAEGWRDFHAPQIIGQTEANLRARRPDGRLFELRVDRCTGDVIAARPLDERGYSDRGYGPQVYGDGGNARRY